ncbi:MAG: aminotransferase DegT, partial [Ignavibacteria bacterium]|nr:aminotransferase DegT [Ignavibacteria bacterium]
MYSDVIDFIKLLYPNQNPIPLHAPVFMGKEKEYLLDCIDSTFVSYVGKYVTKFEEMTAE